MSKLYYEAPNDQIFNEVKEATIKLWKTYDDTYGYATEKVERIKDIQNISDNLMFIVSMFDLTNQAKLAVSLSKEARDAIGDRLRDGGLDDARNQFN